MNTTKGTLAFFREGRPDSEYVRGEGYSIAKVRPRISCRDGFDLSVQAGELLYSAPRSDAGPWSKVEVGYPSARPEPWSEWEQYAETPSDPTGTVYGYVPLTMVESLVALHGGEA